MSRLEKISEQFRQEMLTKNTFSSNDDYNAGHPNAVSDGDVHGKGENNGLIGSSVDIASRKKMLTKNKFSPNNPYTDATA